jgi:hypothetical protein
LTTARRASRSLPPREKNAGDQNCVAQFSSTNLEMFRDDDTLASSVSVYSLMLPVDRQCRWSAARVAGKIVARKQCFRGSSFTETSPVTLKHYCFNRELYTTPIAAAGSYSSTNIEHRVAHIHLPISNFAWPLAPTHVL